MGFTEYKWAYDQWLEPAKKLILIVLSNNTNEVGEVWFSWKTIMRRTGLKRSTVHNHLTELRDMGLITWERRFEKGRQKSNIYKLNLEKIIPIPESEQENLKGNEENDKILRPDSGLGIKLLSPESGRGGVQNLDAELITLDLNRTPLPPKKENGFNESLFRSHFLEICQTKFGRILRYAMGYEYQKLLAFGKVMETDDMIKYLRESVEKNRDTGGWAWEKYFRYMDDILGQGQAAMQMDEEPYDVKLKRKLKAMKIEQQLSGSR